MWGKIAGFVITLAVIGYIFYAMNASDRAVREAVDGNPALQEQKRILESEGIDPNDPEALRKYTLKKARELEEFQRSAEGLPKE